MFVTLKRILAAARYLQSMIRPLPLAVSLSAPSWLGSWLSWIDQSGLAGDLAFFALYGLTTLSMVPASWSSAAAGYLYGPIVGFFVASLYTTFYAAIAFTLGRSLLQAPLERRLAGHPRLVALDRALCRRGLVVVALLRLAPIVPFNVLTYLFAATRVQRRDFVLGTWLGGLGQALLGSQLGASAPDLAALLSGTGGPSWLQSAMLVLSLVLLLPLGSVARSMLREIEQEPLPGG